MFLSALPLCAALVCCAAAPAQPQTTAHLSQGDLTGAQVTVTVPKPDGTPGQSVTEAVYKAIPYTAAPVGQLRWKPPAEAPAWTSPRDASKFGASCMQSPADWMTADTQPSEDCLTLNIWSPAMTRPVRKLPVFVWIHGGGFLSGSAADPKFDGASLAAQGVVVVTLNYRLGVFGWMAHPQLTAESPEHTSGNYGLLDQMAALRWVRQNIAAFGGDPSHVTVAGESAGGTSIAYLLASPRASGLFQGAILESASRLFTAPIFRTAAMNPAPEKRQDKPTELTNGGKAPADDGPPLSASAQMPTPGYVPAGAGPLTSGSPDAQNPPLTSAEEIGLAIGADIGALRDMSAADLMTRAQKAAAGLFNYTRNDKGDYSGKGLLPLAPGSWIHTGEGGTEWQAIVDGVIVPAPVGTAINAGCGPSVPVMIGTNADEGTVFVRNLQIKTESDYRHYLNDYFAPVFAGIRGAYGGQTVPEWKESISALIRDAFFDYGANRLAAAETARGNKAFLYEFARTTKTTRASGTMAFHGAEIPYVFGHVDGQEYDDTDRKLSLAMQKAWARFVKTGDPNEGDVDAPKTPVDISFSGQLLRWPVYSTSYPRQMELDSSLMDQYVLNTVVFATFDRNYRRYQTVVPAPVCSAAQ